jgi:hypothetical protein
VTLSHLTVEAHCFHEECMALYMNICAVEDEGTIKLKFVATFSSSTPFRWFGVEHLYLGRENGIGNWKDDLVVQDDELCVSDLVPSPHGLLTFRLSVSKS